MMYHEMPLVYWYDTNFNSSEVDLWFGTTLSYEYTCYDCSSANDGSCRWAWDAYNTHGDCLAIK